MSAFGTKRTCRSLTTMSAFGGKADINRKSQCPLLTQSGHQSRNLIQIKATPTARLASYSPNCHSLLLGSRRNLLTAHGFGGTKTMSWAVRFCVCLIPLFALANAATAEPKRVLLLHSFGPVPSDRGAGPQAKPSYFRAFYVACGENRLKHFRLRLQDGTPKRASGISTDPDRFPIPTSTSMC